MMNSQTLASLNIPEDILNTLVVLSPEQRHQVFDFVRLLSQQQKSDLKQPSAAPHRRIPDLDRGAVIWMSDDFDAPLGDDFWCGANDPLAMTPEQIQSINHSIQQI